MYIESSQIRLHNSRFARLRFNVLLSTSLGLPGGSSQQIWKYIELQMSFKIDTNIKVITKI
jgi:hypothetical protein